MVRGTGKRFGGVEHFVPLVELVAESEFGFDDGNGAEHDATNASEGVGIADGNAVLGYGGVEAAHREIDVGGGHEIAGDGLGEFGAELFGFDELGLGSGVKKAEARVFGMAKHAAAAAVSERELAEGGFRLCGAGAGRLRCDHGRLPWEKSAVLSCK